MPETKTKFSQIHIDVSRNSTDDFNLFHDEVGWSRILNNPFEGPIVLGFQIESLIEDKVYQHRQNNNEMGFIETHHLNFSNYQFSFVNAIRPDQIITIDVKDTQRSDDPNNAYLSNRITVRADNKLSLVGFKKESKVPLFLAESYFPEIIPALKTYPDRSFIEMDQAHGKNQFFLKRKFMSASNAKNFLCGSNVDQRIFFDELINKYQFSEMFPCAFISCALLEKSLQEKEDFEKSPLVYISHKMSVDRQLLFHLKSNNMLHILIHRQLEATNEVAHVYECYGIIGDNDILFRALIECAPLDVILRKTKK